MEAYNPSPERLFQTDVLVVGSGSAGATAAIAAAREGLDVALVERYGFMGGISTQVLDTFYGFYTPGEEPRKVVGGVPNQVVDALRERDACFLRPNTYGAGTGVTYDPEQLKVVWETLAREVGARLLYHAFVVDALVNDEGVCGVVAATKRGHIRIDADVVIDATGDADVAAAAGVPFEGAADGPVQAYTTTFRLINVDTERACGVSSERLHALMNEAAETGEYQLPRREGSVHRTPTDGVMHTNMVRVGDVDGTDPEQLTEAEIEGRRQALEYARFLRDYVPGYERATLSHFSTQIGIRESRRIFGEYRLTQDDVLGARSFDDAIGLCAAPIEEHHSGSDTRWEYLPEGETYEIPYRCLVPKSVDGLLVVGRCVSADHDAHASVRNMGQCMLMGQAAGVAAGQTVRRGTPPRAVDTETLRERLREIGAVLGEPSVAPEAMVEA